MMRNPLLAPLFTLFNGLRGTLLALILSPILIGLALWLPPVSLGVRIFEAGYTRIPIEGGVLTLADGAELALPAEAMEGNSPLLTFSQISRTAITDGIEQGPIAGAVPILPEQVQLRGDVYVAEARESAPAFSLWRLPIPPDSDPVSQLDVYAWDGAEWRWIPHTLLGNKLESRALGLPLAVAVVRAQPLTPQIGVVSDESLDFLNVRGNVVISNLSPRLFFIQGDDNIGQYFTLNPLFNQSGGSLLPVLRNVDPNGIVRSDLIDNLLVNQAGWEEHFVRIEGLLNGSSYEGIVLDYRNINPVLRDAYSLYVESLAQRLIPQNKSVIVRVGDPIAVGDGTFETGAYDWVALGAATSGIRMPIPPTFTYADTANLANFATQQVNRYRLTFEVIVAPTAQVNGVTTAVGYTDVSALADAEAQPLLTTSADDAPHRVTVQAIEVSVENRATLQRRLAALEDAFPLGITIAEGAFADPTFWEAVVPFASTR
jgi:hypothetical protein